MRLAWIIAAALALAAVACWGLAGGAPTPLPHASASVAAALSGTAAAGYRRADAPRTFDFPADHGPHPGFRTEWWYYTGNLEDAAHRRFGFQLTFFTATFVPEPTPRASAWAASTIHLAHFAVSDIAGGHFHAVARTNRGALDLAGAQGEPYRVWNGSWSAEGWAPTRLRAAAGEAAGRFAIDLELQPGKPPVLQGDHGLSRKGPEPGNASYYYSLTRMPTAGTVRVGDTTFAVTGLAWMDREWSTSALSPEVVGWDWFALPLDDGSEVMLYRLRRRDGTTSPFSAGTLVDADGAGHPLSATEFAVAATSAWTSPRSGVRYASGWTVTVPGEGLELRVAPLLADQELDVGFRYWEGACSISGTRHGRTVAGRGYAELTGYDEAAAPVIGTGAGSGAMR